MKFSSKIRNNRTSRRGGIIVLLALFAFTISVFAQNNTNSPYTRFGYGRLQDIGFSRSQSMGGAAYGLRTRTSMNPANPATNSSIDSTSFLFEFGVSGLSTTYSAPGASKESTFTGNLEYLAFQLPLCKWLGLGVGVLPYSFVGYNYSTSDMVSTVTRTCNFQGRGGINQVYLGLAGTAWKRLSLGVNVYYMFGSVDAYRTLTVTPPDDIPAYSTVQYNELHVSNVNFRYGIQYQETIGRHSFCLGFVYDHISKLNGTISTMTVGADTVSSSAKTLFDLPSLYGAGVSYTFDKKLTIAFDYTMQEFSKARYFGITDTLTNRQKFSLGAEYIYKPAGGRYVDRMRWRLGASYSNSYFSIYDNEFGKKIGTRDIAITCGIGFPLRTTKTMVNLNFEYGNIAMPAHKFLTENYFKIGINLTLNEMWFFKQRIQ